MNILVYRSQADMLILIIDSDNKQDVCVHLLILVINAQYIYSIYLYMLSVVLQAGGFLSEQGGKSVSFPDCCLEWISVIPDLPITLYFLY